MVQAVLQSYFVMDDAGFDDESASIVIVGGGRMHWLFLQLFMSYVMTTSCEREQVRADTPIMIVPSPHLGNISHSVLCCLDVCTWIRSLRD